MPRRNRVTSSFFYWAIGACLAAISLGAPGFAGETDDTAEFRPLLAGDDLSGWVVEGTAERPADGDAPAAPIWTVEDGVVHCDGSGFGFLRNQREVADFALRLQYRLAKKGNSGIGIRGVPYTGARGTRPSFASYEIQLLDDAGQEPSEHSTCSLYRYVAPQAIASKPAGEWNDLLIECRGPRIRITLNGQVVQDFDQSQDERLQQKPLRGYIQLQNHGRKVDFRNIELCELAAESSDEAASADAAPAE